MNAVIREYLKDNILVTDGAMGTYYSKVTEDYNSFCEFANIDNPNIISNIHGGYIKAGAKLLRTNTFSANTLTLDVSREKLKEIITKGYMIAKKAAAGKNVFVAADIGPINRFEMEKPIEYVIDEYKFIVDVFMDLGADIFVFETLSSADYLEKVSEYIKSKNRDAFILTQFAVMQDGFTREGISIKRIIEEIKEIKSIDAYGFNCGSGPTHLYKIVKNLKIDGDIVSVLPNAGYPEIVNERMVYVDNPDYFADKVARIKNIGAKILGGCCGTTPKHIEKLVSKLNRNFGVLNHDIKVKEENTIKRIKENNKFWDKLLNGECPVAVELDPPFDVNTEKIMHAARVCKENDIDLVTVADSPMSKVRVDSIAIAAKIKREIGIDAMPHMCCRDKNINAIRSSLLAAHIAGIRNILAITGDPVTGIDKVNTKSVFNLNSFKLMNLISGMNKEVFKGDEISVGGALNLNVLNKEHEVARMNKKAENGGKFFLTQPIFEDKTIDFLSNMGKHEDVKIIGGVLPLVSYRNVQFINNELFGVNIPEEYVERFKPDMTREEAEEVGVNLSVELINKIKNYVDGIYIVTPFNRIEMVIKILKKSGM
ncbi:bifunctional homocysteine S-methyltransferase/methylenetetrahydrofolate reductase [Clostridium sp. CT7]|uniref:bifunctional homocysteine S-methyltransferase/methylenetetrahydrofolate reductase n=2 Tax=Clostridium TaxID=1485 RepID=UPI001FA927D3|nr:bifunctional homocysteine S-methyltransferase/methylenetetrahydrofolate reductase [Clostridium sp. CT7]